jgi:hypothetical protein
MQCPSKMQTGPMRLQREAELDAVTQRMTPLAEMNRCDGNQPIFLRWYCTPRRKWTVLTGPGFP